MHRLGSLNTSLSVHPPFDIYCDISLFTTIDIADNRVSYTAVDMDFIQVVACNLYLVKDTIGFSITCFEI